VSMENSIFMSNPFKTRRNHHLTKGWCS
jgi:hypothetical protein